MKLQLFEKITKKAILHLPRRFREKMNNVAVTIEEKPTLKHYQSAKVPQRSVLLGLYQGVPLIKRSHYSGVLPDKIILFQKSIESLAQDEENIKKVINRVLQHEIAHHFGMNEGEVRAWERKKNNN